VNLGDEIASALAAPLNGELDIEGLFLLIITGTGGLPELWQEKGLPNTPRCTNYWVPVFRALTVLGRFFV